MPPLPLPVNDILHREFWLCESLTGLYLEKMTSPVKFTATVFIYVRRGGARIRINLQEHSLEAPSMVTIHSSQIMEALEVSDDFDAAFLVLSDKFMTECVNMVNDMAIAELFACNPVMNIPACHTLDFELLVKNLRRNIDNTENRYINKTVLFTLMAFFFQTGLKCMQLLSVRSLSTNHIASNFLRLAQEHFRRERFLTFYADKLQITPKHLSRTVKTVTGISASEWIDRLVILEAKVLLKSSSLNIQQIADSLNFPSQSFFGKYFKKNVGVSPKEFRNS